MFDEGSSGATLSRRRLLRATGVAATGVLGTAVSADRSGCRGTERWQASGRLTAGDADTYSYRLSYERPCRTTVWVDGPADADVDLYVSLDGRVPDADDHDRRSQSPGAAERIELDAEAARSADPLGIAVEFYAGSGEYTVGVEETGPAGTAKGEPTGDGETRTLSASATTLSYIPGLDENEASGGNDFDSAMPDTGSGMIPFLSFDDVPADGGFYGDGRRSMPESLSEALSLEKHVEGIDRTFHPYRFRHSLTVSFETTDRETVAVDGGVEIAVNGAGALGDYGEYTPEEYPLTDASGARKFDVREFETGPTHTILEEQIHEEFQASVIEYVDDERYRPAHRKQRTLMVNREAFARGGTSVEGIRVSTLWGASNPYTHELTQLDDFPVVDGVTPDNPVLYTWLELTVLADGTRLLRIPDASVMPRHAAYLDGHKRGTNGLEVVYERGVDSGDGYDAAIGEEENNVWRRFRRESSNHEHVPYGNDRANYLQNYADDGWAPSRHPVVAVGETPDGPIGRERTLSILDRDPLPPFPVDG